MKQISSAYRVVLLLLSSGTVLLSISNHDRPQTDYQTSIIITFQTFYKKVLNLLTCSYKEF